MLVAPLPVSEPEKTVAPPPLAIRSCSRWRRPPRFQLKVTPPVTDTSPADGAVIVGTPMLGVRVMVGVRVNVGVRVKVGVVVA